MYENEDDDLFLSDIGSLSQIYDKKQRFGKNFNPNYKKRGSGKPMNPYLGADKRGKPTTRTFEKHLDRNSGKPKEEKAHGSNSKFSSDNFQADKPAVNLYEDEDIQVVSHTKSNTKENTFSEGMYDEFELNVNSNNEPPTPARPVDPLTKTKNDAPWIQNRESRRENDAKRLLEFERSLKQEELLGQERFSNPEYFEQPKQFPVEHVESQAKTVRSFQREQLKFNENYSKWAYDDAYDNEDKSSDEKENAPYDPEQYDDSNSDSFNRARYTNPEPENISGTELLDENYPNAPEMTPYRVGKLNIEHKLEGKLRKENPAFRSNNQKFKTVVSKGIDEDVIILDDSLINENTRVQNEVNKKIKISFTSEHKPKSIVTESIFPDDSGSPDILIDSSTPPLKSGHKIPVLSRKDPSPLITPTPVTTVPSFPPPAIPGVESMPPPRPPFSNTSYSMVNRNYMNFNTFGAPIMNEMPPGTTFIPGRNNEFFANNPPPPGTFTTPHAWVPPSVNQNAPSASSVLPKEKGDVKEPQKSDKPAKDDAVKDEIRQQNKKLMDQRNQYYQKYNSLNEELDKLKKQKKSLVDKKSHQAEAFLKENNKLQSEIQNKIKAVKNVIDMLSKIIKDEGAPKNMDGADENAKPSSTERDEAGSAKDTHKKSKRKHSRSRSKSRHRSRSRSRSKGRRSRSRSKGRRSRSHSHSRSRHRSRTRSRSRSHSPKRYRRRSRSRDKYYRRRRSYSREKKSKPKKPDKEDPPPVPKEVEVPVVAVAVPQIPDTVKEPVKPDPPRPLHDRFKPAFEEVFRPVEPPKPKVVENGKPPSRFSDKPPVDLPINAIPEVPATLVEKIREIAPPISKGYQKDEKINYVYYDPEIHWCRVCNVFPKTAKEYLMHLHAAEHKEILTKNNLIDYPWHKNQPDSRKPVYPNAPTERIPIRGLPFFVSATAWYCKLCNEWMGDLHCASAHLKSDAHEINYLTFLESNPKWDEHWLDSRNKAHEAMIKLKAAESITPAYSTETYVKPAPLPPPPPPLQMREKKKKSVSKSSSDDSSSSSSSSSSDESDKRKKKKKDRRKERKRSPEEKTDKPRQMTDAKKAREMAKKAPSKCEQVEKFEAIKENEEDDKFVQEWMNPVRGKSKEREFMELKNKLKKKEVVEKSKIVFETKKRPPTNYRRHGEPDDGRSRHEHDGRQRHDDDRSRSRNDDPRSRPDDPRSRTDDSRSRRPDDDKFKRPRVDEPRTKSSFSFNRSVAERESSRSSDDSEASRKCDETSTRKPLDRSGGRRFPFIGKMPSKNPKKPEPGETKPKSASKASDTGGEPKSASDLPPAIKKTIEEYDKANDVDIGVVDMDINDDEDEPVSIVIDDNISRKKDFDETLKLLYPEDKPPQAKLAADQSSQAQRENVNAAAAVVAAGLPPNITQDYLVSLIESTLLEKLKFKIPAFENQSSQIMEIASSMKQALFNNPNIPPPVVLNTSVPPPALTDIPIPFEDTTTVHITAEEQLYNVPLPPEPQPPSADLDDQDELAPPGTTDDLVVKKKKNPISQKKRRHLRKIREKLEEQEKMLQEKIEERKNLGEEVADEATSEEVQDADSPSPPRPINAMDSDLMMLGIDEDDSAALLF